MKRIRIFIICLSCFLPIQEIDARYWLTPYSYCGGNPVNNIDPDGMDQYDINGLGMVVNIIKDEQKDAFYRVDRADDGSYHRTGAQLLLPYSTISAFGNGLDSDSMPYNYFIVNNTSAGTSLFEFFADNTSVEWTIYGLTSLEGNKISTVSSSHKAMYDASGGAMQEFIFSGDYVVNEHIHNHPSANPVEMPSGLLPGDMKGDVFFARDLNTKLQNIHKEIPSYKLYVNKKYINWNANSKPSDFGRANDGTWLPTLPEIICRPIK